MKRKQQKNREFFGENIEKSHIFCGKTAFFRLSRGSRRREMRHPRGGLRQRAERCIIQSVRQPERD